MARWQQWVLTDVDQNIALDSWDQRSSDLNLDIETPWSVQLRTLRGGLREGVQALEVSNGPLSLTVLPTRGMGIWRGHHAGTVLGWQAPLRGPVHPKFVDAMDYGGLGWLAGFDEWIVRCGLNSMGAPGVDTLPDGRQVNLGLHGRIANVPTHYLEVRAHLDPPYDLEIIGRVEEGFLFHGRLELDTRLTLRPGESLFRLHDTITNRGGSAAEVELLYHCNFGRPLLEEGSKLLIPHRRVSPRDAASASQLAHRDTYPAPRGGMPEEAFFYQPITDELSGQTLAVLCDATAQNACAIRYQPRQLPWFVQWKNPGLVVDGYVTGLEPALQLPNQRSFERKRGRVPTLAPGEHRTFQLEFEVADGVDEVAKLVAEVERLQQEAEPTVDKNPVAELTSAAE